jgi:hypothetical protein
MNFFYVTSFITEKISEKIIEEERIENFVIISNERYNPYGEKFIYENEIYEIKKPLKSNLVGNWKNIIEGKNKISKLSEGGFSIYVPNTNIETVQILLSHDECEEFSFIEEGFTSYCELGGVKKSDEGAIRKLKNYVSYMGNIVEGKVFREGYSRAYCLSEYAFPGWERKKIINTKISPDGDKKVPDRESCILVIDSMRTLGLTKKEVYISTLSRVTSILEDRYKNIYFKLHPDNYINENDGVFKSIIEMSSACTKEIDQERSIERLAVGSKSDVIVNLSSAGLYCLLFSDSKVYTFYDMFRRHAERAGLEAENILGFERFVPDVFWDNALPLEGGG